MGLAHGSPRQTTDIDLTAGFRAEEDIAERIERDLEETLAVTAADLGYTDTIVRVEFIKKLPRNQFDHAKFPGLKIRIFHGVRRLDGDKLAFVNHFDIDVSFNEPQPGTIDLEIAEGRSLLAYALVDLIAEKYRAILQQIPRRRQRSQDIYDLDYLIAEVDSIGDMGTQIHAAMMEKCLARNIEPYRDSLDNPEIKRRSSAGWQSLTLEVDDLPDFERCFASVKRHYKSLPWKN